MKKSIKVDQKSKRGRPSTGRDPMVSSRIPAATVAAVDAWAAERETTRSDAIRQLVELGLTIRTEARSALEDQQNRKNTKQRARELASNAIDKVRDPTASPDDQSDRKRKLVKGPEEFQGVRRDQPNRKA
ncbi:ribbon-helix-helix protein, CopG family [Bradyrhizobium sp. UFLA 03-164]|uniref:Ribbon-helix-helix protein, CopG family n=2 Tax=Bradyrhizobium uaiense TaxID=2594946 RepID=A0A6P1BCW0_9BRAD|nr:ribbon-helix-helix protein, CopG family [Bradyrhizobium uaiense]